PTDPRLTLPRPERAEERPRRDGPTEPARPDGVEPARRPAGMSSPPPFLRPGKPPGGKGP
ncbi:MAG TPA: hypothetical protein PKA64_13275, partial [Myxococcota bacterium]|nr:hypothetical protein [Myxococcota bacterium]